MSADLFKLKEEIKEAEIKIEHMSVERETLMERLKVSQEKNMLVDSKIEVLQYTL